MEIDDFRRLFYSVPSPYLVLAPDLTIVEANDSYLRATMTVRESIIGRHLFEVFPGKPGEPGATGVRNLNASLQRVLAERRPDAMAVQRYDIRRPDGSFEERHWSPLNVPTFDETGRLAFIIHHVEDVTEYVRLQRAGIAQTREVAALRHRAEFLQTEIFARAQELQRANEELRDANAKLAASQARLMRTQRLEAVGQLTGGVAHDFNNLLTAILGSLGMLETAGVLAQPGAQRLLDVAERAATRGARLISHLLAFSGKQMVRPETVDINTLIRDFHELLKRAVTEKIEVVLDLDPSLRSALIDPAQFQSALLNLAVNARDAMPAGGRLTITTRPTDRTQTPSNGDDWAPGQYSAIVVSDTGTGMLPEIRDRAFEPFFTTKDVGEGSGLGLSQVYGFAKQAGGHAEIDTAPGAGTSVTIYLPKAAASVQAAGEVERTAALPETAQQGQTVLIVEDDHDVRQTTIETFAMLGYSVLAAADGREAVATLAGNQRIDLLFADIVMPHGVSGVEVAKEAARLRKDIKILLTSGYPQEALTAKGADGVRYPVLSKPYRYQDLVREVERISASA